MIEGSIVRRWARALLELVQEQGELESAREQLNAFQALLRADAAEFAAVLESPSFSHQEKIAILRDLAKSQGMLPVVSNFLALAVEKDRARYITHIVDEFNRMADEISGVAKADLIVSESIPEAQSDSVRKALEKATGKKIKMAVTVDPEIVGGAVIRMGDLVVDASIRAQLEALSRELVAAE